mmetsp:Transcript_163216/g.523528  ORF Transcript_163216/g.523528 Transcript_163216/m.523528 type:complete len:246 (+) Transcript_163216:573-1310(+)
MSSTNSGQAIRSLGPSLGEGWDTNWGGNRTSPLTRTAKAPQAEVETASTAMLGLCGRSFESQLWQTSQGHNGFSLSCGSAVAMAKMSAACWNCEAACAMAARSAQSEPAGRETSVFIPRKVTNSPLCDLQMTTDNTGLPDFRCQKASWSAARQSSIYFFSSSSARRRGSSISGMPGNHQSKISGGSSRSSTPRDGDLTGPSKGDIRRRFGSGCCLTSNVAGIAAGVSIKGCSTGGGGGSGGEGRI